MKKFAALLLMIIAVTAARADDVKVASPDGRLTVTLTVDGGVARYEVEYDGKTFVKPSALGVRTSLGDFSAGLTLKGTEAGRADRTYAMRGTKASEGRYVANLMTLKLENAGGLPMNITFSVGDNDVAFRYSFPQSGEAAAMTISGEATSFRPADGSTTFLCPQSDPMAGWMRTKPSYEEDYTADAPMAVRSAFGRGYTFPCLFRVGQEGWMLVSETGTDGGYPACHLSDYTAGQGYTIAFPMSGEANGWGSAEAAVPLPCSTPWRTITVGKTLAPIVETTVPYDLVSPKYEASEKYKAGRYTWSWLIWQDASINYADQKRFVDLAAEMGYEYVLVDAWWDTAIGRDSVAVLSRYARSKGVSLMLWYNSNGFANDAPQGPKNCMNTAVARKKEMAWLRSIGVKGIKVDFFGGDKQHTMQLYEDILSDANDYGIQVIFHGCTLPRGWERMYPNYVASEAVLASENVYFSERHARLEAFELTMHPYCRNAVGAMDWGGTIMNRHLSRDNKSRHRRYTTDAFEMAAGIVCQSSIQCVAIQPNNLTELPKEEIEYLKAMPAEWDETRFVDGYPGRYVVLARRCGDKWYVAGLNAGREPLKLSLSLPMLGGGDATLYSDGKGGYAQVSSAKAGSDGRISVTMQPDGGFVIVK